jgi:hypothetical protein
LDTAWRGCYDGWNDALALTGIIFAVELTGKVELLVPLLVATGSAYAVTVLLLKRSILTEKVARRGQHITRENSVDPFELLRVSDVMVKTPGCAGRIDAHRRCRRFYQKPRAQAQILSDRRWT